MLKTPLTRRTLLKSAMMIGASSVAYGSLPRSAAVAQENFKVSFQLSWIKSIQYGGYFAALENGYFLEEGIEAEFVSGGPGIDAVANVAVGQSVMGDRPSGALIIARDRGIPIKVIGTAYQKSPGAIMSLRSSPVETIADLAGKSLALPNTARPVVLQLLRDAGIDPDAVDMVPVGTDPGILASGQVDAYYGLATNQGMMLQARGVDLHLLNLADAGAANMGGTIYAREEFLEERPEVAVRWLRAAIRGWRWALDNPEETADLMVNKHGAPGLDLEAQLGEIKASKEFIEWGAASEKGLLWIDIDYLDREIGDYHRVELIRERFAASDMADDSFIAAAHG